MVCACSTVVVVGGYRGGGTVGTVVVVLWVPWCLCSTVVVVGGG